MTTNEIEKKFLNWEKCKSERLIYSLLLLSDCKTKEDFEEVFKNPYNKDFSRAIRQIMKTLPSVLKNYAEAYKDETE